jgi:hypothetical protein
MVTKKKAATKKAPAKKAASPPVAQPARPRTKAKRASKKAPPSAGEPIRGPVGMEQGAVSVERVVAPLENGFARVDLSDGTQAVVGRGSDGALRPGPV